MSFFLPRYCGQVSLPIASLMSHTSPTSLWYPLAKRTTISLVSGSLHLLVYFCKKDEVEAVVKQKLSAMSAVTETVDSKEFVVMEKAQMPRVNSDDFVVVDDK